MPKLKNIGIRNKFEDLPPRPVDPQGYMTAEFITQSRGKAQGLSRKLMKLESRRFPADRRYGEKFDKLLVEERKRNERTNSLMLNEQEKLLEDFGFSTEGKEGDVCEDKGTSKPKKKFKELKVRKKNICSRESLFNCILDTTVITVEPRPVGTDLGNTEPVARKAKDWSEESIAIAQSPGFASRSTFTNSSFR